FLGGTGDDWRGQRRGDVDDRGGRSAGCAGAAAVAVARGRDDAQARAFVGFGDEIGEAAGARDAGKARAVVGLPLVADGGVAVVGERGGGGERLAFLRRAADGRRRQGRGNVDDCSGHRAGGAGTAAVAVAGGGDDAQGRAFVRLG